MTTKKSTGNIVIHLMHYKLVFNLTSHSSYQYQSTRKIIPPESSLIMKFLPEHSIKSVSVYKTVKFEATFFEEPPKSLLHNLIAEIKNKLITNMH